MNLHQIRKEINILHQNIGYEIIPISPIVSWSFPGQFCYCINEEFIWDRYGTMINLSKDIHFNKMQTAFRWDDFVKYFLGSPQKTPVQSKAHLGIFDLATIPAGHIVATENSKEYVKKAYEGLFDFLINKISLKRENFIISYFPGEKLSILGKNQAGKKYFNFDFKFPEDKDSLDYLLSLGFNKNQLIPDSSRDCFLIPHWSCGEIAPWGYRHEINYKTKQGIVDIATIERLVYEPIVINGEFVGVKEWDKNFIISGVGLERVAMVSEELDKVQDVENIKNLYMYTQRYQNSELICESLRAFHRIFSDTNGDMRDQRSPGNAPDRKSKYNKLKKILCRLPILEVEEMLRINAGINPWYNNLNLSIKGAIIELVNYSKNFKVFKNLKY